MPVEETFHHPLAVGFSMGSQREGLPLDLLNAVLQKHHAGIPELDAYELVCLDQGGSV